ncbi:transglutaminase TgpA family protein [Agromyces sp. Marseille-Q5079]|uniref:transglutaminase TgpA family protein n=1 Tax=Agromyces sp. Marseille-Q5079 TaxID=3439059 RepID=UPI003D9CA7CD
MHPDQAVLTPVQRLALTTASFVLMATAIMALGPLIAGSGWWWLCAFVSAGVLFAGAGLRAVRVPGGLVPVLEAVVLLMLLTLLFGGSTGLLFLVPLPDTFALFGELFSGAQRTIAQQSVPAVTVPALSFALALGVGVLSILLDVLVQVARRPAFAAVPVIVPLLIPGFIVESGVGLLVLVLVAASYLLLLRVDVRVNRAARFEHARDDGVTTVTAPRRVPVASTLGASLGVAGVGIVVASMLAVSTPSISTSLLLGTGSQSTLFARGVSPFIDLGRDLRRPEARPAFRYLARDGDRPYFTLLTLDRFEGDVWSVADRPVDGDNTVDAMGAPVGLSPDVETSEHPIDVLVNEVRTTWLPVPYPSTSVEGLRGSWFWDEDSLTVRSADTNTAGQRYEVTRLAVEPTVVQLREAGPATSVDARYLELPEEMPEIIGATAVNLASGAATPYDAAVAIQAYLRSPDFRYSTEAPVEGGYDGGGFDVIGAFLEQKQGYCVHFASTMAVLAREAGIPARISIGYTSGTPTTDRVDGVQRVEVDTHDLHAWPELYFEGVGWVPFEPTPGRGSVPEYSRPGAGQSPTSVLPTGPASSTAPSGRPELDPDRGLAGQTSDPFANSGALRVIPILFGIVALLAIPSLVRALQRGARRRRIRQGREAADAAWREFVATATDIGIGVESGTPRAIASLVAARPAFHEPVVRAALLRLRDAVERARFGPDDGREPAPESRRRLLGDLDAVRSALLRDAAGRDRAAAALLPRSLVERVVRVPGVRAGGGA